MGQLVSGSDLLEDCMPQPDTHLSGPQRAPRLRRNLTSERRRPLAALLQHGWRPSWATSAGQHGLPSPPLRCCGHAGRRRVEAVRQYFAQDRIADLTAKPQPSLHVERHYQDTVLKTVRMYPCQGALLPASCVCEPTTTFKRARVGVAWRSQTSGVLPRTSRLDLRDDA
jgi:hypothetical protein